jgi:alkanesulfonate monooxygenase SsuD/methylene tetrahydromethanopterin reductase-like flavin-dependent oxidoreductase (luciferase family)
MLASHPDNTMTTSHKIPLSMLDLVAVREGRSVADALSVALRTAQHAETLGFRRYWLAEHHNMAGIASSATAVLVGYVQPGQQRIRVGSGGIMLPNHAPWWWLRPSARWPSCTRAALIWAWVAHPEPTGPPCARCAVTVQKPSRISRVTWPNCSDCWDQSRPGHGIVAMPGANTQVPIWLLGSSLFSAQLAAERGLPYAFAAHFAPRMLHQALDLYRQRFRASAVLARPYAIVGVPLIAAPTDAEAEFLASSTYQRVLGILTGDRQRLQAPVANFMAQLQPQERAAIGDFLAAAVIGGPDRIRAGLQALVNNTGADELMLVCDVFDPALRLRSLDIAAAAADQITRQSSTAPSSG